MKRRWLWLLVCVPCTVLQAGAPQGSIKAFIDHEMPASGMPGVAYAVVADGRITSMGARGVARLGGDRRITPDTPFLLGSISKSFTALAVMQLVEAGKVDLDARLSVYLHGFAGRPAGAITIRQLLSHTSGFSTRQGNTAPARRTHGMDALAERVEQLHAVTPAYRPGERWAYSNINYQILGRLVEVLSGQSYQAYVTTHILQPLGMNAQLRRRRQGPSRHGDRASSVVRHRATVAIEPHRPRHGPARRHRRQCQRHGALSAHDDGWQGRRAARRRQGADDASGEQGVSVLRVWAGMWIPQTERFGTAARAPGSRHSPR